MKWLEKHPDYERDYQRDYYKKSKTGAKHGS